LANLSRFFSCYII